MKIVNILTLPSLVKKQPFNLRVVKTKNYILSLKKQKH